MNAWKLIAAGLLLAVLVAGCGQQPPAETAMVASEGLAMVDGRALDAMDQVPPIVEGLGDAASDGIDFDTVRVQVQNGQLMLRVNVHTVLSLQNYSNLQLLLDTDNNPGTGRAGGFNGAEVVWRFGQRNGLIDIDDKSESFKHGDVGIVTAPTVTSDFFEVSIPLDAKVHEHRIFQGNTAGIAFLSMPEEGGLDRIPDSGFVAVDLTADAGEPEPLSMDRPSGDAVRMVTWNILHDGIVERPEKFDPIFDVLDPDIVTLVEVWDTPAQVAADLFDEWRPLPDGQSWHADRQGADIIVLSKWPILECVGLDDARATAYLLQMPDNWSSPLFVIGAHAPCCGKDEKRQKEIDAFMAFLRDARDGTGPINLGLNTPVVITGDMNLVGLQQQLTTLVEGQIVNEAYLPAFGPDADGTALTDLFPRHLYHNLVYTWRDEDSSYGPGKLDYIVYSDSNLEIPHSFIFDTRLLPQAKLDELGLTREANPEASDHLPVIVDVLPR